MRGIGGSIKGVLAMAGRKSPWGGGGKGDEPEAGDSPGDKSAEGAGEPPSEEPRGPRNPWFPASGDGPRRSAGIEDIFRARRGGGGGGGGGGFPKLPPRPNGKSWTPVILGVIGLLWVGFTSLHQLSAKEQGVVTTLGKYTRTIGSGVSMTMPWPIQSVEVRDVTSVINDVIPENEAQNLVLTSDQNLIDLSFQVRWRINDLKLFTFAAADPRATIRDVAEAAMRASVAEVSLKAIWDGSGRGTIETDVRARMQRILNAYRAGVLIMGVDIKKADPPNEVADAFQKVNVAQQNAQRDRNNAEAFASQTLSAAQGNASAFDKVYEQYRLSPEVTRRRMYYDTMERVLANNDKVVVEGNGVLPYLPLPQLQPRPAETVVEGRR